jgi:hypothetical protein
MMNQKIDRLGNALRLVAACFAAACASRQPSLPVVSRVTNTVRIRDDLTLRALAPEVFVHTSWHVLLGVEPFPSNGLVLLGPRAAQLVDTAWGEAPTVALLRRPSLRRSSAQSALFSPPRGCSIGYACDVAQ